MKRLLLAVLVLVLAGCATPGRKSEVLLLKYAEVEAAYGMSVNELRATSGVTVETRFYYHWDLGNVGSVSVSVAPAATGAVELENLLARLRPHEPNPHTPKDPYDRTTSLAKCGEDPDIYNCGGTVEMEGRTFYISIYTDSKGYGASFFGS